MHSKQSPARNVHSVHIKMLETSDLFFDLLEIYVIPYVIILGLAGTSIRISRMVFFVRMLLPLSAASASSSKHPIKPTKHKPHQDDGC
jgi:hypothetical protein